MFVLFALALVGSHAKISGSELIAALAKMEPGIQYYTDGAADASVMTRGENQYGVLEHPSRELADIVSLGPKAIPLLISHLDCSATIESAW